MQSNIQDDFEIDEEFVCELIRKIKSVTEKSITQKSIKFI